MNLQQAENEFNRIATGNGWEVRKNLDGSLTLLGGGFAIWILFRIERMNGVFVTFSKNPPSDSRFPYGYGIAYLARYKTGRHDFVSSTNDFAKAVVLIDKYCVPYLKGEASDYSEFEEFAIRQIEGMATVFPDFTANKWIRPEWT